MNNSYPVISRLSVVLLDNVIIILSFVLAAYVRYYIGFSESVLLDYYINALFVILLLWRIFSGYLEAYSGLAYTSRQSISTYSSLKAEIRIIVKTTFLVSLCIYIIALFYNYNMYSRWNTPKSLIVLFAVINLCLLILSKIILYNLIKHAGKKEKNAKRVLILGSGDIARQFIESVRINEGLNMKIIGLLCKEKQDVGKEKFGYKIVGCSDDLLEVLHSHHIDELIVALPARYMGYMEEVIAICDKEGLPTRIISPFFRNLVSKSKAEVLYGLPNITFVPVERNDLEMAIKRIIDIIVSLSVLLVLSPVLLIIALLIKLTSQGPVFYRWKIVGINKKHFVSYKFRTMVENAEELEKELRAQQTNEMDGVYFKLHKDFRVTPVGRFLRKFSLDEIPQLYSVLKGDLSLVGPRPVRISEKHELENWHRRRFCVKPGVTSPWVVKGKNIISDFDEIAKLDLDYIDNWSLFMDFKILLKTIPIVIFGKNF